MKSIFLEWLGERHCYRPQTGKNLGERLKNAFDNAFEEGFSKVVAIGSDSPDLPVHYLKESFEVLQAHDAVIGPANDGGYYLIGFSKEGFIPEAFDNISWSTDSVFEQTVSILKRHGRNVYLLPLWHDVDTIADLKSLLFRTRNTAFEKSKTYLYLTADELWSKPDVRL
jgi:rSAM/selenodomain-associated transferase 1